MVGYSITQDCFANTRISNLMIGEMRALRIIKVINANVFEIFTCYYLFFFNPFMSVAMRNHFENDSHGPICILAIMSA